MEKREACNNKHKQTDKHADGCEADIQIERERCSVEALVLAGFAEMATFFFYSSSTDKAILKYAIMCGYVFG